MRCPRGTNENFVSRSAGDRCCRLAPVVRPVSPLAAASKQHFSRASFLIHLDLRGVMSARRSSSASAHQQPRPSAAPAPGCDLPSLLREAIGHSRVSDEDMRGAADAVERAITHLQAERAVVEHSPPLMQCVSVAVAAQSAASQSVCWGCCILYCGSRLPRNV